MESPFHYQCISRPFQIFCYVNYHEPTHRNWHQWWGGRLRADRNVERRDFSICVILHLGTFMQNLRMARHQNMFRFFFLELGFGWSLAGIDKMKNWKDKSNRNWSWLPDSLMLLACKFWIIIALLLQSFALPNSSGKVNLKHLLWQLREQQSALSAVTELRQEAPWGQRTLRSAVVNVFSLRFFGHEISMCFVCFAAWNDSQVLSLKLSYNAAKADFQSEICGTTWHESWNNGRNIKPSKLVFWCLWSCQAEFQPVKEDIETIRETIKKAWFVSWCSENPADLLLAHLSTRFT